jgi:hypothetical protein
MSSAFGSAQGGSSSSSSGSAAGAAASPAPSPAAASAAIDSDCGRYLEAAASLRGRGDREHAEFFGRMSNVCQAYKDNQDSYSPQGRDALDKIRPRLAQGLERDRQSHPNKSGSDLKKEWIANHPQVYKEAGVCDLPMEDKARIVSAASPLLRENPAMAVRAVVGAASSAASSAVGRDPLSEPYRAASSDPRK